MVVSANNRNIPTDKLQNNDKLKEEVIAHAQNIISRRNSMPIIKQDDRQQLLYNLEFQNGSTSSSCCTTIVSSFHVPGFQPKMLEWYMKHLPDVASKCDPVVTFQRVDDDDDDDDDHNSMEKEGDFELYHQRVYTPWMISNRSMIHKVWKWYDNSGTFYTVASTKGNQELAQVFCATKYSKDVIATADVVYTKCEPKQEGDGCHLTHIMVNDIGGSIPDMIKKKIGQDQSQTAYKQAQWIMKNYKEKQ